MADNTPQAAHTVPPCNNTSVGVIVWRGDCPLLLERKKYPFGMACPAGHVEPSETYEQAAARELREETGLVARSLRPLAEGDRFNRCRRPGGDWHHWQVFEAEVDETQQVRQNADESKRLGWYAPAQVIALAARTQAYRRNCSLKRTGKQPQAWKWSGITSCAALGYWRVWVIQPCSAALEVFDPIQSLTRRFNP